MSAAFKKRVARKNPNDPIFTLPPYKVEQVFSTYAETQDWGLKLMGIPALWRLTKGAGCKVAVLDTGAALTHPDLKDAIVKSKDFTGSKSGASDVQGHGTHCCGIIGARENATGVVGVAPECQLFVGKVLGDDGSGTLQTVAAGIDWAIAQGVDVISMSLGSPEGAPELEAAIGRAVAARIFVCCAAGNEGPTLDTVGYPAMYPNVISVGAIDQTKTIARFSSRGTRVDIVAPGVEILSDYPPRNLAKLSGTSMATPFVAGVVALMVAKHKEFGTAVPIETPQDLIKHLHDTALDAGPKGFDPAYGFGLINPTQLLQDEADLKPAPQPEPTVYGPDDFSAAGKTKLTKAFGSIPAKMKVQVA